jgi:hypothetical protein
MAQVRPIVRRLLKAALYLVGLIVVALVVLVSCLVLWKPVTSYVNQTPFDSAQWKASLEKRDPLRQRMVSSLVAKHHLLGQTKTQVDQLLGTPPTTGYFKDYDLVYWLGPERSLFGIDSEWLCLKLQNGKVSQVDILTD